MKGVPHRFSPRSWCVKGQAAWLVLWFLGSLGFFGCESSSDIDTFSAPVAMPPGIERRIVEQLSVLYGEAVMQEDIDRLYELLDVDSSQDIARQPIEPDFQPATKVIEEMAAAFRQRNLLDFRILPDTEQLHVERQEVSFLAAYSELEPTALEQRTRLYPTTFRYLPRQRDRTTHFLISEVKQALPALEIVTLGQVVATVPARLEVRPGTQTIQSVRVEVRETGELQMLTAGANDVFWDRLKAAI